MQNINQIKFGKNMDDAIFLPARMVWMGKEGGGDGKADAAEVVIPKAEAPNTNNEATATQTKAKKPAEAAAKAAAAKRAEAAARNKAEAQQTAEDQQKAAASLENIPSEGGAKELPTKEETPPPAEKTPPQEDTQAETDAKAAAETAAKPEEGAPAPAATPTEETTDLPEQVGAAGAHSFTYVEALAKKFENIDMDKISAEEQLSLGITSEILIINHWAKKEFEPAETINALKKARELLKDSWTKLNPPLKADTIPTPAEIDDLAGKGDLDYREVIALRQYLKEKIEKGEEIPRLEGNTLDEFKKLMEIKEKSWYQKISGGGWLASITILFKKLGEQISKLFDWVMDSLGIKKDKDEEKKTVFESSPIAKDQKFTIKESSGGGYDLKADKAGQEVTALTKGKVIKIDKGEPSKVVIENGDTNYVYEGLDSNSIPADISEGTEITTENKVIGKMITNTLRFQMTDKEGKNIPEAKDFLATYSKAETTPAAPDGAAEAGTTAAAGAVAAAAAPEAAPPTAAAPTTTPTPAPAPAAKTAATPKPVPAPAAAAPTAPAKPAETAKVDPEKLKADRIKIINERLKPFSGAEQDLSGAPGFNILLPFLKNEKLTDATCIIIGNTLTIDGIKYNIELPHNAKLQKIKIQGNAQEGSAELTAGVFMLSDTREIQLKDMIKVMDELYQGKEKTIARIGSDTATFTKA